MKYLIVATRVADRMRREFPYDDLATVVTAFAATVDQAKKGIGTSNFGHLEKTLLGFNSFKVTWSDATYSAPWGGHEWIYTVEDGDPRYYAVTWYQQRRPDLDRISLTGAGVEDVRLMIEYIQWLETR